MCTFLVNISSVTAPTGTLPPTLDGEKYKVSHHKECQGAQPWQTLEEASTFCNRESNCKGIHLKNCDESSITTCTDFTPLKEEKNPKSDICIYEKVGKKNALLHGNPFNIM